MGNRLTKLLLTMFAGLLGCLAFGDGGFFALQSTPEVPSIPYQRALIQVKDDARVMIVESVLNGPSAEYAWIIPVPSGSCTVEAVSPGTLQTIWELTSPPVRGGREPFFGWAFVLWGVVSAYAFVNANSLWHGILRSALIALFTAVPLALLFPVFAGSTHQWPSPMALNDGTRQIGSYDVRVLSEVDEPELAKHVSSKGRQVLTDYASEGWCFVVAKMRKDKGEDARPHPLKITYKAAGRAEVVYPMRLTGAATDRLMLDLYVIDESPAQAAGLEAWSHRQLQEWSSEPIVFSQVRFQVGHPELTPLMWDKCYLTHLRGEFDAQGMARDISIEAREKGEMVRFLRTPEYANSALVNQLLALLGLAIVVGGAVYYQVGWSLARTLVVAGGLFALTAAPFVLLRINAVTVEPAGLAHYFSRVADSSSLEDRFDDLAEKPIRNVDEAIEKINQDSRVNLREGDVPFGYTVRETKEGWDVVYYDRAATPYTVIVKRRD